MKNNRNLCVFISISLVVLLIGCQNNQENEPEDNVLEGNGNVITSDLEIRDFDFNTIVLNGNRDKDTYYNINIFKSETFYAKLTTDSNIKDYILVYNENNNLNITHYYFLHKFGYSSFKATELNIDIYLPEIKINKIELNGRGSIKIHDGNNSDFDIIISGIGNVNIQNYEVKNVSFVISGTGNISAWVKNNLTGIISGVGNILYKGNPSIKNINITGTGNVDEL